MTVHLVSVLGGDVTVVPQMIEHYRGLGIESFHLVRHAESAGSEVYERTAEIVEEAGLKLARTHVGPWDEDLNSRLIQEAMDERRDDWFVVADLDEFQLYDRPLPDLLAWCEREGYDLVEGCYLDRLGRDGSFPEVLPGPLWEQFPLAGMLSFPLLGATPTKVTAARGGIRLEHGHHRALNGRAVPHREVYAQVHHFKWNDSVVSRMRRRKDKFQSGEWKLVFPTVVGEVLRFLDHLAAHGGRIDVSEPLFMFHPCGDSFADYPHWAEAVRQVHTCWPANW
ncbi:hypothetical protein GCM10010517_05540 [Streptosporangium fragile]|uniref:Glycosyltransferase family 2 protein n=1 Tax=Streptosporangium fragile TaxID=46186 RepID=A0ABP6I6A2_9ACTN